MEASGRFKRCFVLGLALAALGGSAAQAGTRPDDRAGPLGIGTQQAAVDGSDVISRYLTSHPAVVRPDDRAGIRGVGNPLAVQQGSSGVVLRPPDVSDAAEAARAVSLTSSGGFHWGDYGAGVGSGIGLILLLAGGLMARPVFRRQRTQTA